MKKLSYSITLLVLNVFKICKGQVLKAADIFDLMDKPEGSKITKKQISVSICDLFKQGHIEKIDTGQYRYPAKKPEPKVEVKVEPTRVKISMDEMLEKCADKDKTQNYIRFHLGQKMNFDYTIGIRLGLGLVKRLGWQEGICLNWMWDPITCAFSLFPHENERNSKLLKHTDHFSVALEMVNGYGLPKPKPGEKNDVIFGVDNLKLSGNQVIVCFKGSNITFS